MKRMFIVAALLSAACLVKGQDVSPDKLYEMYFEEAGIAAEGRYDMWDKELYGPYLLIDPRTGTLYANMPDKEGLLVKEGNIYTGKFPGDRAFANTAIEYGGMTWAMIMLPLSSNKHDRLSLMIHEYFHVLQPELGFEMYNPVNRHLNEKDGRIYLRLELEALREACKEGSKEKREYHIANAMAFREYRRSLYPGAADEENKLELNEGLADYTGTIACGRPDAGMADYFSANIDRFYKNTSFSRSFAYHTIPLYGYLLGEREPYWNKNIKPGSDITAYLTEAFGISLPADLGGHVSRIAAEYNGEVIMAEETERAIKMKELTDGYRRVLVEEPHLKIPIVEMNLQFDPRRVIPLDDRGIVYPIFNLFDEWGVLRSGKAALVDEVFTSVTVSAPTSVEGSLVTGDGWTIELNEGYGLVKDGTTGNFTVKKTGEE